MSEIWSKTRLLIGQKMETLIRKKGFTITEVADGNVYFVPDEGTGTRRWVTREMLEHIAGQEWATTDLRPSRIMREYPSDRNSSYMAAILRKVMAP